LLDKGIYLCMRWLSKNKHLANWRGIMTSGVVVGAAAIGATDLLDQFVPELSLCGQAFQPDGSYAESLQYGNYLAFALMLAYEALHRKYPEYAKKFDIACYAKGIRWITTSMFYSKPLAGWLTDEPVARAANFNDCAAIFRPSGDLLLQILLVRDADAAFERERVGDVPRGVRESGEHLHVGRIVVEERERRLTRRTESRERRMDARQRPGLRLVVDAADGEMHGAVDEIAGHAELLAQLLVLEPVRALDENDRRGVVVVAAQRVVRAVTGDRLEAEVVAEVVIDRRREAPSLDLRAVLRDIGAVGRPGHRVLRRGREIDRPIGHARIVEVRVARVRVVQLRIRAAILTVRHEAIVVGDALIRH